MVFPTPRTAVTPWPLLPISWFIAGTAATGWFVVGHDCAHRSFRHAVVARGAAELVY